MTLDYVRENGTHGTITVPDQINRETCDRCGPSVVAACTVHTDAGPLTLCGHHGRKVPARYLVTLL